MALLTAEEADRIVRANFEVSGATSDALMAAWRGMVFAMLERLDLGEYRRDVIMLLRDVVNLWGFVQPARTYDQATPFAYPDVQASQLIVFFDELHRLAMATLLATPELPPRDEAERRRDIDAINEITLFARRRREETEHLARTDDASYIQSSAAELTTAAGCCQTLVSIALGAGLAKDFRRQYDECISAWTLAIPLIEGE
jgi:hypothetical protein